MKRIILLKLTVGFVLILFAYMASSQETITGTIKGQVLEQKSGKPIPFATVRILDTDPNIGVVSDLEGAFILANVPVGRVSIEISFIGYDPYIIRELLVTSGKDVVINTQLSESVR